jgi:hypothetical protein
MNEEMYRRAAHVVERCVAASTYLIDPGRNNIHCLNATGAAVWRQLAEARSRGDLISTLHAAFRSMDRRTIEKDIEQILDELHDCGLIVRCE